MSRFFTLILRNGNADYEPPENPSYSVWYKTKDSTGWYDTIEEPDNGTHPAVVASGNMFTIEIAEAATTSCGELALMITGDDGYQLTVTGIITQSADIPGYDSSEVENYYNVYITEMRENAARAENAAATAIEYGATVEVDETAQQLIITHTDNTEDVQTWVTEAEAWAVGQRDGVDVPSTDETYHNNAKYYAESASGTVEAAEAAAESAAESAEQAAQSAASLTVDTELSSTSTNPVQNKVIDATVTELKNETTELKSALNDLQITVDGVENYEKGKKLITAVGDTRGQLTPDSNFATSEFIDISLFGGNGKIIKVEYGEISENTMFALYNSNHVYLDSWSLATNATNRQFTFSYTSYTDPKYVRFSFENGINAKISIMGGVTEISTVWQTAATGGNTNDIASLQRIVNNFPNTYMMDDVYIDLSMINRLDPAECEPNKIVIPSTGSVDTYSGYFTTDFIPIYPGETLRFWRIDNVTVKNVRMFAAFDSDKNVIPSLGSTSEVSSITQSGDMAFVKCSILYLASDFARTPEDTGALTNANPVYIPGYGNNQSIKSKYLSHDVVWIRKTDTESQIIQKFVDAFANGNTDVYFERASYEFGTELAKVNTDYGMLHNEIPVGNGCRYYFNGSTLTATIDLSQHPAVGDDEFYCNFFGCQRRPSSFEMHDGVLIATDTRYVIHDESSALTGSFKHLYQNMEMHYNTNARQETIRKCIGGGTGESGVVEIVGCKFSTDASDSCVSYHGNGTDVIGAEFDLNVRDCWFSNSIRAGKLSEHQTGRFYYTGNSAASAPSTYVGWTVTSFLNETRT